MSDFWSHNFSLFLHPHQAIVCKGLHSEFDSWEDSLFCLWSLEGKALPFPPFSPPLAQPLPLLPTVLGGEGCESNYAPRKRNNVKRYFQSLIQVLIQYLTATKQYVCSESNKSHTPKICLAANELTGSIVEMYRCIFSINLWPLWGQLWTFIHLCTPTAYLAPYLTHSSHSK